MFTSLRGAERRGNPGTVDWIASLPLAMTKQLLLTAALLLTACRRNEPPAPSAEQSAQLNEAEDLLNAEAAKEKGPENRSPGPSNSSD